MIAVTNNNAKIPPTIEATRIVFKLESELFTPESLSPSLDPLSFPFPLPFPSIFPSPLSLVVIYL